MTANLEVPPRHRNPKSRPYSRKQKYGASVTTVLGSLGGGDGLMWGAANETAAFAIDNRDLWDCPDRDLAYDRLRKHFRGLWDGRASMGTLVHAVNEAWTWGDEADIDELVRQIAWGEDGYTRATAIWQGRERFAAEEAEGYVDGLEAFWRDFAPETVGTEEIVRYEDKHHGYIGTRDWTCRLRGLDGVSLLDIKTTAKQSTVDKPDAGLYFDKFRLQLAAYRCAKEVVRFGEDGEIAETWPNYPVARCGVLHLRGDGRYQLFEVQAGADEWATFLRLIDLHRWSTSGWRKPPAIDHTPVLVMEGTAA